MKTTYVVAFGQSVKIFFAAYHAYQFCRALDLNGTKYVVMVQS